MNADITLCGKVYKLVYSDKAGSLRRSITDGAALPHTMKIAHTETINSRSKIPTMRSLCRLDMTHKDTAGVNPSPQPVSVQLVVEKGLGVFAPTITDVELVVDSLIALLSTTAANAEALDQTDEIFANLEQ